MLVVGEFVVFALLLLLGGFNLLDARGGLIRISIVVEGLWGGWVG